MKHIMQTLTKLIKTPEFIAAVCMLLFVAIGILSNVSIKNVTLERNGHSEKISLPYSGNTKQNFFINFEVVDRLNLPYSMWILPNDCVESIDVGTKVINLQKIKNHCSSSKGITLEDSTLAPHRTPGKTHYSVMLRNLQGPGGIMVSTKTSSTLGLLINSLAIISFALLCTFIARRFRIGKTLTVLFLAGVIFRSAFFLAIPYKQFSMDVEGHISYIQYIWESHSIPDDKECWSCYHPPVYYLAAVPSYVLGEYLGFPGTSGLQAFSLLLSVLTAFLGILFLRKILDGRNLILASLLWIFWPLAIMVSPRIGNDQLFYLLHVLCMWAGISYVKEGHGKYLIVSAVASALALWTKTTAIVTLGMFVVFALGGYFANARQLKPTKSEIIAWALFAATLVTFLIHVISGGELVGNANALNSSMKVPNELFNYLYFDLRTFLEHPFTSCWSGSLGRDFFWNFVLKTSMFGEYKMLPTATGHTLATVLSILLLVLIAFAARGFWKNRLSLVHWILLLHGIAFTGALIALRAKYPYACSADFRYILPVLLSFCPFVASGITLQDSSLKWKVLGYIGLFAFIITSSVLYIMVM